MQISSNFITLAARALAESMTVKIMVVLARKLMGRYDLHEQTGFPKSVPIPNRNAARQIVNDIKKQNLFLQFVNLLIDIQSTGLMGRRYTISHLKELISGICAKGYIYDKENKMFVEDSRIRKTRNWGALREGQEYILSFLRIDIVGSSLLVKNYSKELIKATYNDLYCIVQNAIYKRNGRIWSWEGDGGFITFFLSNKNLMATLSAMEIIHELFLYNHIGCRLEKPLKIRVAVHNGRCEYSDTGEDIMKNETIKRIINIESKYTKPNTMTISGSIHSTLDPRITKQMKPVESKIPTGCYYYELGWKK